MDKVITGKAIQTEKSTCTIYKDMLVVMAVKIILLEETN